MCLYRIIQKSLLMVVCLMTAPLIAANTHEENLFEFPLADDFLEPEEIFAEKEFETTIKISETKKNVVVTMNIPDIDPTHIEIHVEDNKLYVSGKQEEKEEENEKGFYAREARKEHFERVISLPCDVNASKMTTKIHKGILTVTLPKMIQ